MDTPNVDAVDSHIRQVPIEVFRSQPWRVHDLIPDFGIEDVWLLPTPSGPDGLTRFVQRFTADDSRDSSPVVRALLALRWKIGGLLGWDRPERGIGAAIVSLRDRLPDDLRSDRGQMAVITKPNGLLGAGYMALIKPIRLWIVYPAMLRGFERDWKAG